MEDSSSLPCSSCTLDPKESEIFQERTKKWLELVLEKEICKVYKAGQDFEPIGFSEEDSETESEIVDSNKRLSATPKVIITDFDAKIVSDGTSRAISRHLPLLKISVKSKVNDEPTVSSDYLFIKLLDDQIHPEDFHDEKRELYFYTGAVPELLEWAGTRDRKMVLGIPRCYCGQFLDRGESNTVNNDSDETLKLDKQSLLVLEDLEANGYAPSTRRNGLQRDEVRAALKELAIIHSLSWAYQEVTKEDIGSSHNLKEDIKEFAQGFVEDIDEAFMRLGEYILKNVINGPQIVSRLEAFKPTIHDTLIELLTPAEPGEGISSLIHMDCSYQNLLFQTTCSGEVKCKIIDWKNAIIGSPALDIACLLMTSVNSIYRSLTTTSLLEYYWKVFVDTATGLKVKVPITVDWLKQNYKKSKLLPIIMMMGSSSLAFDQVIEKLIEILQEAVENDLI